MTDEQAESAPQEETAAPAAENTGSTAPDVTANDFEEWKPEPRKWTWSDIFAAPMLAFKPKCMIISLLTLIAVGFVGWLAKVIGIHQAGAWTGLLVWLVATLQAATFIFGSSLVATFFKADLLDDEFLSLGEALKLWSKRIVPSLMVPLFMSGIMLAFWFMLWGGTALSNIPFIGPLAYPFLYPLAFPLSLVAVLISIAVFLSIFVAPAIVAIRNHAWLDNVIDTFEAVGTKPHILVTNAVVTGLMVKIAFLIGLAAVGALIWVSMWGITPGKSTELQNMVGLGYIKWILTQVEMAIPVIGPYLHDATQQTIPEMGGNSEASGLVTGMGHVLGVFQAVVIALLVGYCVNLWIAGGMMTYLFVREDDYWDDSDLEDFDKLAKELEEEARQAEAAAAAEAEKLLAEQAVEEAASEDKADEATASDDEKAEPKDDGDQDGDSSETAEKPANG